ncbi:hypothetical protein HYQ46_006460 [Verticillium longisporum]|nr:hypothetical protein HYQ46_006460 [Verticillium longisporum]
MLRLNSLLQSFPLGTASFFLRRLFLLRSLVSLFHKPFLLFLVFFPTSTLAITLSLVVSLRRLVVVGSSTSSAPRSFFETSRTVNFVLIGARRRII